MSEKRYVFIVEWYDTQSSVVKKFNFTYFVKEKAIEMLDLKNQKVFLKKIKYPELELKDLFIGSVLIVFSRQIQFVDYADVFTRNEIEGAIEKTLAIIKPDAYLNIGKCISEMERNNFSISNIRMTQFTPQDAGDFYAEHKGKQFFEGLVNQMSTDLIVGVELVKNNAIKSWREVIGPTDPEKARQQAPKSLRALYGEKGPKNVVHGSDSAGSSSRELNFFFSNTSQLKSPATFNSCTVCIIKPHIVKAGKVGEIVDIILTAGFEISALQMFYLDLDTSKELFEVYRNVLPEYSNLAEHLSVGPSVVLEIRQEDAVNKFRELCGPYDPEIAKNLRPNTIRALYGIDRVQNAVHCTDLAEDGRLEVEYFFNILMVQGWKK